MQPSGRVGPVRVRGRQASMFLLCPPSLPLDAFISLFLHLILSISSFIPILHRPPLPIVPFRPKQNINIIFYICKLNIFHKINNLFRHLHTFGACVYIKYTSMNLVHFHIVSLCVSVIFVQLYNSLRLIAAMITFIVCFPLISPAFPA